MTSRPHVTVITPFYNTERYLAEAVESVLTQTYDDFDYLLLNNRSTDRSLAIAEEFARRDSRVRVTTNSDFLAQDMNFSEGLRLIAPEARYAKIVLADDMIFPQCLEKMIACAEAQPTVGIVSSLRLKGTEVHGRGLASDVSFLRGRDAARFHLQTGHFLFGSQSTVLLRAQAVREIFPFFDPNVLHGDTESCYRLLRNWDFGFVHDILSFSRVETDSVAGKHRDFCPDELDNFISVRKFGRDFLDDREYRATEKWRRRLYFNRLGQAFLDGRDEAFWRYHRDALAPLGVRLRKGSLWPWAARILARRTFCIR